MEIKKTFILSTKPVCGRLGIHKLYAEVADSGRFPMPENAANELWVIFVTQRRNALKVIHIDASGVDLTIKKLSHGNFSRLLLIGEDYEITSSQFRRLMFDGTLECSEWQFPLSSLYLEACAD